MPHSEGPTTIAMAIAATAAALPFVAIAILNTVMVVRRTPPLNQVVENYMRRYPLIAAGLACFVGALAGHIFWSTGDNPSKPPAIWYLLPLACLLAGVVGVFGAGALGLLGTAFQPLLCSRPSSALALIPPDPICQTDRLARRHFNQEILISLSTSLNSGSPVTSSTFLSLANAAAKQSA